jgi:S-formylglutathione hydrolase FrmB
VRTGISRPTTRRRVHAAGVVALAICALAIPVVAVWAVVQPGSSTTPTSATSSTNGATRAQTVALQGTEQTLHVAVPGDPGVTRTVRLYRPAVADSADLPVLYLLHGFPGSASDAFDAGLPQVLDQLVAAGYPPFVLVAPDGNGAVHSDTEWANAVDGTDQFETFLTTSVIDAVEGSNLRSRSRRAIAGFSMGGYGAVNVALHHPDLYGQVVPIDGYFHVDDTAGVFDHDLTAIDANTPELHGAAARDQRVLVIDGLHNDDRVVKGESKQFVDDLVAAHVPVSYEQLDGDHTWSAVATAFPDVVRFLDASWGALQPPVPMPAHVSTVGTRQWSGTVGGAHVDVSVIPTGSVTVSKLEHTRSSLGAAPVSYVFLTVSNPRTATHPVSLFKVSFVDADGTTVDANPARSVLANWLQARERRRRSSTGTTTGTATTAAPTRDTPLDAAALTAAQQVEAGLTQPSPVDPGTLSTTLLVTTTPVRSVNLVFAGDSYGDGSLAPTS